MKKKLLTIASLCLTGALAMSSNLVAFAAESAPDASAGITTGTTTPNDGESTPAEKKSGISLAAEGTFDATKADKDAIFAGAYTMDESSLVCAQNQANISKKAEMAFAHDKENLYIYMNISDSKKQDGDRVCFYIGEKDKAESRYIEMKYLGDTKGADFCEALQLHAIDSGFVLKAKIKLSKLAIDENDNILFSVRLVDKDDNSTDIHLTNGATADDASKTKVEQAKNLSKIKLCDYKTTTEPDQGTTTPDQGGENTPAAPEFTLRDNPLYDWKNSSAKISSLKASDFHAWSESVFAEFGGVDFAFAYKEGSFYVYFNNTDKRTPDSGKAMDAMFQIRITFGGKTLFFNLKYNGNEITALEYQAPGSQNTTDLKNMEGADSYVISTGKGWAGEMKFPVSVFDATMVEGQDYSLEYIVTYIRFDFGVFAFGSGELEADGSYSPDRAKGVNYTFKADQTISTLAADKTGASYVYKSATEDIVVNLSGLIGKVEEITVEGLKAGDYTLEAGSDAGTAVLTIKKEALTSKENFNVVITDTKNGVEANKSVTIAISVTVPANYGAAKLADGADPSKNTEEGDVKIPLNLAGEKIESLAYNKQILKEGEDYTYDASTGILTIKASYFGNKNVNKRVFVLTTENDASRLSFTVKYVAEKKEDDNTNNNKPDDNNPSTPGNKDDDAGDNKGDETKKEGCKSSLGLAAGLSIAIITLGAETLILKKKKED